MSFQPFLIFLMVSMTKPSPEALTSYLNKTEHGVASYYAAKFEGRDTYFGEKFDNNEMTAAHPSLPYNTLIEVTNLANNKKVTVRINDRGPYAGRRVLDLSKTAARQIDMIASGLARVAVKVIGQNGLIMASKKFTPSQLPLPEIKQAPESEPEEEGFLY